MATLHVTPTVKLSGQVKAPPSKSYTIRALVAGLLSDGVSRIRDPLYSLDTEACIRLSEKLGAGIKKRDWGLEVAGTGGKIRNPGQVLDSENSGTTIRILSGVAALCPEKITLTGDESIQKRPIGELLDALKQLGVEAESKNGFPPHTVKGPLAGGLCKIRGDVSSQFISSLLMSAPYALKDTVINVSTPLKSRPYVDLTLDVLAHFKVRVENKDYRVFTVPHGQTYSASDYTVEGDYSSGAFILAAAALTESDVTVKNLFEESKQADKKIVEIIRDMGADVESGKDYVKVKSDGRLSGINMDLSDSPDLVPVCSVLGALAEGETVIENVEHARLKECDRIHAMAVELSRMGADISERRDGLEVRGGRLSGAAVVDSWGDHRIVMSMAVAGLKALGETVIKDAEASAVTFPDFVELMKKMGAGLTQK